MPSDVHRVVQNPQDVDRALARRAIEDEMSSSSAVTCNMERTQAGLDVLPRVAIGRKRIIGQCDERADECLAIDRCLSSPELLGRPLKDSHIVVLGWLG